MLKNPALLKGLLVFLIFVAVFVSFNIPFAFAENIVRIGGFALALIVMLLIFRLPSEKSKYKLNLTILILLVVTLIAVIIAAK